MKASFHFRPRIIAFVFLFISLLVSFSCKRPPGLTISDFAWLEGNWKEAGNGYFSESWVLENDNALHGIGVSVEGSDTLMSERLKIFKRGSQVYYQALVAGQNNDKPVEFVLSSVTADSLVFENPGHDFPKLIVYRKLSDQEMTVLVADGFESDAKGFTLHMFKSGF
jgi:hypothetical protein